MKLSAVATGNVCGVYVQLDPVGNVSTGWWFCRLIRRDGKVCGFADLFRFD